MQNFYQVMTPPLYDAMQWIKNNTPQDSVLVADALYGWWLSGFTQRQTLSGSEPQYLILSREFEPAKNVKALLDTNYVIDNGLIQVREDGGYIGRHNPLFLANLNNSYFPHGFFHFTSDEITIKCRVNGENYAFGLSELHTKNMHFENTGDSATITLTRSNHLFNVTQTTTVYRGIGFSNMSLTINTFDNVDLSWAQFFLHTKYAQHFEGDNYYALIDSHSNVGAQLIFTANQPDIKVITRENPSALEMTYALGGGSDARIEIFIGVFQIPYNYPDAEIQAEYLTNLILNNTKFYDVPVADLPLDVFNYRDFLRDWNVSYVVLRDVEAMHRFRSDPVFSLVFANEEVTIFKVK